MGGRGTRQLVTLTSNRSYLTCSSVHLCSCSSFSCWLLAHYVYPIRVRFPNILTGKVDWIVVGFIPIVKAKNDSDSEKERVRMVKDEVLQRCLAVLLDDFITASEKGVLWDLPGEGPVWVVPRVVLYAADQPEERHLLGLKLSGCKFQCSHCMLDKTQSGCPNRDPPRREVLENVEAQILAAKLFKCGSGAAAVEQLSATTSIVPIVPLLAAVHGLGTGSLALYDIFGFDLLHVRTCLMVSLPFLRGISFLSACLLHVTAALELADL